MRKILFFCFLLFSSLLFANPVTNVRAMQEGKKIVLLYDIAESAYVADVKIRVYGASRLLPLNTLSGDVGREVEAGRDRRIEYDVLLDYVDGLRSDNISFVIMLGAQAVDLGLSVKWASCNVGANRPEEYGDYFAWGEVKPKSVYDCSTYKYCNGSANTLTKYNKDSRYGRVDNKATLDAQDDAATVNWGGVWRMPTKAEQDELRTKCKWVWTTLNGVNGYKVTGPNGNSIFLPAAGYMYEGALRSAGSYGNYWPSSLSTGTPNFSYNVYFYSDYVGWSNDYRYFGRSVRPVCPKKQEHEYVDLGLSVKWATCNVGANSPEEYGDYFAWGEVKPKSVYDWYDWTTYKYCNGSYNTLAKYNSDSRYGRVDNKSTLEAQDDAATVNWGSNWRMPTKEEQDELRTKCKWEWTKLNGVNGYKVIGPNGNSIFLPAAGCMYFINLSSAGSNGKYWSSSLDAGRPYNAYEVSFSSSYVSRNFTNRGYGKLVRPVCQ